MSKYSTNKTVGLESNPRKRSLDDISITDAAEKEDESDVNVHVTKEQGKKPASSVTPTSVMSPTCTTTTCTTTGTTTTGTAAAEETKAQRDERRMEINRLRAKDIRKRKKKMVEDMQKQIIYLSLENDKLRTQLQIQQVEINLLRNNNNNTNMNMNMNMNTPTPITALGGRLGNTIQVRIREKVKCSKSML